MAEITVKTTKKGDKSKVDEEKIAKGTKPTQAEGAQAQSGAHYITQASCWNCWAINVVETSTTHYMGFYCWNCGAYCEV